MMVDANIWIAYVYPADALHARARNFIDTAEPKPLGMFEYTVVETATVLAQHSGKEAADRFLDLISDNAAVRILPSSPALFRDILHCYKTHSQRNLSFVDYALLHLSQVTPIATFDTKLRNAIRKDGGSAITL